MKTTKWMASLAVGAAMLGPTLSVNAQYVQNTIAVPIAPGCGPGEGWTKNGARYQCETPQPSCAYGFASGPVWIGSSWSFSCNAPPPPSQPPPGGDNPSTPADTCAARAASVGISLGPLSNVYGPQGNGWSQYVYNNATGPEIYDINGGNAGYGWVVDCNLYPDGVTWAPANTNPFEYFPAGTGTFVNPPPQGAGGG